MKLFIHSQTSTVLPLKFGNGWAISSPTLYGLSDNISMLGLKLNHISKRGPGLLHVWNPWTYQNGLAQNCSNSITDALECHQFIYIAINIYTYIYIMQQPRLASCISKIYEYISSRWFFIIPNSLAVNTSLASMTQMSSLSQTEVTYLYKIFGKKILMRERERLGLSAFLRTEDIGSI